MAIFKQSDLEQVQLHVLRGLYESSAHRLGQLKIDIGNLTPTAVDMLVRYNTIQSEISMLTIICSELQHSIIKLEPQE